MLTVHINFAAPYQYLNGDYTVEAAGGWDAFFSIMDAFELCHWRDYTDWYLVND